MLIRTYVLQHEVDLYVWMVGMVVLSTKRVSDHEDKQNAVALLHDGFNTSKVISPAVIHQIVMLTCK